MCSKKHFLFGAFIIIVLQIFDLWITYRMDPNLYFETNLYVSSYGLNWTWIIAISFLHVIMVMIPYYHYCLIFRPKKFSEFREVNIYLNSRINIVLLFVFQYLFSFSGLLMFCIFLFSKIYAILNNLLILYREAYFFSGSSISDIGIIDHVVRYLSEIGVQGRNELRLIGISVLTILILIRSVYRLKKRLKNNKTSKSPFKFGKSLYFLFFFLLAADIASTVSAKPAIIYEVELNDKIDNNILIFNMDRLDRIELSDVIKKIVKGNPSLILINAYFPSTSKDIDSISSLWKILSEHKNIFLAYYVDTSGKIIKSFDDNKIFSERIGLINFESPRNYVTHFSPIKIIEKDTCVSLALMAARTIQPHANFDFKVNESIPITFWKRLVNYANYEVSDFRKYSRILEEFEGKIVIIGYIGPENEDKYYTPIGDFDHASGTDPDTYGSVILANEIRTLLNYGN